jgi:hypothetical protein
VSGNKNDEAMVWREGASLQSENWTHSSQFKQKGARKEPSNREFSKSIHRIDNSVTGESDESQILNGSGDIYIDGFAPRFPTRCAE